MVRIFGLDIPSGLEDIWAELFQFTNKFTQSNFVLKTAIPTRAKKTSWAARSLFVRWAPIYDGLDSGRHSAWTIYWGSLPFSSHIGAGGWPGSGFSAFVYLNAPRYRAGLSLLLDPPSVYILDQSQSHDNGRQGFGNDISSVYAGQSFVPSVTKTLSKIELYLSKSGSPSDDIVCKIYSNSSSIPGTLIATSDNSIPGSSLGTGFFDLHSFFFLNSLPLLTSGTTYWIRLERSSSIDPGNFFFVSGAFSAPSYANGVFKRGDNSGAWFTSTMLDMAFFEYYFN